MVTVRVALGLVLLTLAWTASAADAQPGGKLPVVGFLYPGPTPVAKVRMDALLEGLREAGFVQGQHFTLEFRAAEGKLDRLPSLAAELVGLQPAVVWAGSSVAIQAMKSATTALPIVAVDIETDAVASGVVASLGRPGGNITGIFLDFPEFHGKWLQLLKEAVPRLARVAVLWDPTNAAGPFQLRAVQGAGKTLGVQLQPVEVRVPADFEGAVRAAVGRSQGVMVLTSTVTVAGAKPLAALALKHKLPGIMHVGEFATGGGLMAYGPNLIGLVRQSGGLIAKVLRGSKPAELPVERPSVFDLAINLKTATALGLTMPPSLLLRASQIIEQ
jgi:putative tryptophan/tyrosine transport system substrate-binding protein